MKILAILLALIVLAPNLSVKSSLEKLENSSESSLSSSLENSNSQEYEPLLQKNCDCGRFWKFPVICTILYMLCVLSLWMWFISGGHEFFDDLCVFLVNIATKLDCWWT
jgi:hypothetical protein